MHSIVRLAQELTRWGTDRLEFLLREREVGVDVPHLTELAIFLLKPSHISRAIRSLPRDELVALSHGTATPTLVGLALLLEDGEFPEVRNVLDKMLLSEGDVVDVPPPPPVPAVAAVDWAQRAYLETQRAVLTLRYAEHTPIRLTRSGTVSKAAVKLVAEDVRAEESAIQACIAGLVEVRALEPRGGSLHVTPQARAWRVLPHPERWVVLAAGLLGGIPVSLSRALEYSGENVFQAVKETARWLFPLAEPSQRSAEQRFFELAEHFGVTSHGALTPPASLLFREGMSGFSEAVALAESAFPPATRGVYVQPDLSVVAPGPLEPELGLQLLDLAQLTAPGLATSLMINERSLRSALDRGWSVAQIREFLSDVSLTPIPQPLSYVLRELEERDGSITVEPLNTPHGATAVRVRDASVVRELLADSRLQVLGFTVSGEDDHLLVSHIHAEHVLTALTEARYPAARATGGPERVPERESLDSGVALAAELLRKGRHTAPPHPLIRAAAERLTTRPGEDGGLDVVPVLELAARSGETLLITVQHGPTSHTLALQPVAVSRGRLRALDPHAQLERTVSLSAITGVEAIHTEQR